MFLFYTIICELFTIFSYPCFILLLFFTFYRKLEQCKKRVPQGSILGPQVFVVRRIVHSKTFSKFSLYVSGTLTYFNSSKAFDLQKGPLSWFIWNIPTKKTRVILSERKFINNSSSRTDSWAKVGCYVINQNVVYFFHGVCQGNWPWSFGNMILDSYEEKLGIRFWWGQWKIVTLNVCFADLLT